MSKKLILTIAPYFLVAWLFDLNAQTREIEKLSDAPMDTNASSDRDYPTSYEIALKQWKTVSEVNTWIHDNFRYDMERAKRMAENSSDREKTTIYPPAEFYQIKKGICVDLSRFTSETLNQLDTSLHAQYLMINFEPLTIDGKIIRKHWISVYEDNGAYYLLGDSKRPGFIAGPYEKVDDFIVHYQDYRDRKVVSWKGVSDYKRVRKKKAVREKKG